MKTKWLFKECLVVLLSLMNMCFVSLSTSLHAQQSGVHRNGWYVGNALMQIDVFPLKLRNDVLWQGLHSWSVLIRGKKSSETLLHVHTVSVQGFGSKAKNVWFMTVVLLYLQKVWVVYVYNQAKWLIVNIPAIEGGRWALFKKKNMLLQ